MKSDAFVAYHGSVNSAKRVGYRVTRLEFTKTANPRPTRYFEDVIYEPDLEGCELSTCFRPVNAIFDKGGHLIVSVDNTGEIFRVFYNTPPPKIASSAITIQSCTLALAMSMLVIILRMV